MQSIDSARSVSIETTIPQPILNGSGGLSTFQEMQKEIDARSHCMEELIRENTDLHEIHTKDCEDLKNANKEINQKNERVGEMSDRIAVLVAERELFCAKIDQQQSEMYEKLRQLCTTHEDLMRQKDDYENKTKALEEKIKDQDKEYKAKIEAVKKECQNTCAEFEAKNKVLQKTCETTNTELDKLGKKAIENESKLRAAQSTTSSAHMSRLNKIDNLIQEFDMFDLLPGDYLQSNGLVSQVTKVTLDIRMRFMRIIGNEDLIKDETYVEKLSRHALSFFVWINNTAAAAEIFEKDAGKLIDELNETYETFDDAINNECTQQAISELKETLERASTGMDNLCDTHEALNTEDGRVWVNAASRIKGRLALSVIKINNNEMEPVFSYY